MIEQVGSASLQRDIVSVISKNEDKSVQQKLFEMVAFVIDNNDIKVQGKGAIALDFDNEGNIEVIGDIKNKDEIAEVLNDDEELKVLLAECLNDHSLVTSEYSQPVDTIEVSDDAIYAYQEGVKNQPVVNNNSSGNPDLADSNSAITNKTKIEDTLPQIGLVTQSTSEEGVPENIMPENPIVNSISDLRQVLGIMDKSQDAEGILSTLSDRIMKQRSEINSIIDGILEENNVDIGDDEDFDISLSEDGSILVKATKEGKLAEKRAIVIQEALNKQTDAGIELKAKLTSMTLDEMAYAELSEAQIAEDFKITDGLAVAFIENQLGASIDSIRTEDGILDEKLDFVKGLINNSPNIVDTLNSSTEYKSSEISGSFTLGSKGIKSDLSVEYSRTIKKHVSDNLFHNALLYNDPKAYRGDQLNRMYPGLDKYFVEHPDEKQTFEVPPEFRIEFFEARVNVKGEVEVDVAKNGVGKELSATMKDVAKEFFEGEVLDHQEYTATFAKTILEEHEAEHADAIDFDHEVKVTFDYKKGVDFEVISPEADEKVAKDLNIVELNLSEGINQYLVEEENITTPVDIEVNEDGKLTASTQMLTITEAKKVGDVLNLINEALSEVDSTEAIRKEEERYIQEPDESDGKVVAEAEREEEKLEKLNEEESKSDIELLGDKLMQKIANKANIKIDTDSEIDESKKMEHLFESKDSISNEDDDDKESTIYITTTIGEASSDVVRQSLADRIKGRLPDGLKGVFEEALGINKIFEMFHSKDSLLKAVA